MDQGLRTPLFPCRELSLVRSLDGELMHAVPRNLKNEIKFKKDFWCLFYLCSSRRPGRLRNLLTSLSTLPVGKEPVDKRLSFPSWWDHSEKLLRGSSEGPSETEPQMPWGEDCSFMYHLFIGFLSTPSYFPAPSPALPEVTCPQNSTWIISESALIEPKLGH